MIPILTKTLNNGKTTGGNRQVVTYDGILAGILRAGALHQVHVPAFGVQHGHELDTLAGGEAALAASEQNGAVTMAHLLLSVLSGAFGNERTMGILLEWKKPVSG